MKKIWISVVVFSFLALSMGRAKADESADHKYCLCIDWKSDGALGDAPVCKVNEISPKCHLNVNCPGAVFNPWDEVRGPYDSTTCETEKTNLINSNNSQEGYCYTSGSSSCEKKARLQCSGGSFYYDKDSIETARRNCQNTHFPGSDPQYCLCAIINNNGMYVGHTCASQATCNKSSCVGVQTYVGAYETTEECDAEYTRRADTATNEVGYCYNNNATECTKVKRSECNSNAGTQKFYYDSNENVAKNKCEDDNLEKDTYCYVANECKPNGNYPKTNVPTICHGTGQVISGHTDNKKECEKKIEEGGTNTGKYCYFGNVNGSPKCVQATIYEAKRNKCDTFRSEGGGGTGLPMITYSDGDGATPTSYADCQSKLVKCCMYKDKNGSHTCECSSSILTKDNKCINTSSSGSLVGGPYNSRADCDSHRPGELPKFKVDEPTEQLSHETLEKMNPLRHSLSNVFGNQSNRNPGYIISRLVKNIIFPISGLILFIQIIWAGFQVVQGGTTGNDNQVNSGKQRLISVIVGFLLLFASYWLWSLVELIFGIGIIEK